MSVISGIEPVGTSTAAFVGDAGQGPTNAATLVTSAADFHQVFGGHHPGSEMFLGVSQFFANGGREAWVVRLAPRAGAIAQRLTRALAALDALDDVNLLCLPGLAGRQILSRAAAYCRQRRAFLIADPPESGAKPVDLARSLSPQESGHVAMYYPRIKVGDPLQPSLIRSCGPSNSVAGILARNDHERGVWLATAGTQARLVGVAGVDVDVDDRRTAALRRHGVNTIRAVPDGGVVLWGARTVGPGEQQEDEWRYIPVRRTALFIEESVLRGTHWVVFEPNDEPTWKGVRLAVGTFLHELFVGGAFAGETPQRSFFVRCGPDTMSERDIDNGILTIVVGFAPLRAAEFVTVRIQQKKDGA